MATLKELSEKTGYSSATISRILNGDPTLSVTEETRRIVLEEAGRSNYIATRSRRGRPTKSIFRVGVAETFPPVQQLKDPYYLYLSCYIRQGCLDRNYTYIPLECYGDTTAPKKDDNLTGIIAIGRYTPEQIQSLADLSSNLVFVDSSPLEARFDSVVLGYELGISLALEHLFSLNHRRIGYIGPVYAMDYQRRYAPEVRRQYFVAQMSKASLLDPALLLDCPMEGDSARETIRNFLDSNIPLPTAFLCSNEEVAIGALAVLRERGLSVPNDISIVSFNDTPKSALVEPSLTSISTHVDEMSNTALRLLAERAKVSKTKPIRSLPLKVTVPPTLVVRESSGPAPDQQT